MSIRRMFFSIIAGTLSPPLVALQALQLIDITSTQYWLSILTLTITSFAASGSTLLTSLVQGSVSLRKTNSDK